MLTPAQVVSFLSHDDPYVHRHALRYFAEISDPSPVTADDYWRAIDRVGISRESVRFLVGLRYVPQTESSYQRMMAALESGIDALCRSHILHVLRKIDFPLLVEHQDELLNAPHLLPDEVKRFFELRLLRAAQPAEEMWERLMQHGRALAGSYAGRFDASESESLIEALGRVGGGAIGERAIAMMNDPASAEDWREIFSATVLGALRYAPATDALVAKFAVDADVLRERVQDALGQIGTVEVIEKIAAFHPGKEWHARLYADEPLTRIKRPESEEALLRLLAVEEADDLRGNLMFGLCELGSMRGFDAARTWITALPEDPERLDVMEAMIATAAMNDVALPEAPEWRKLLEERDARLASEDALSLDEIMRRLKGMSGTPGSGFPKPQSARAMIQSLSESDGPPTMQRAGPKVGRNDPCPCGSGKKYKKCCMT